MVDLDWKTKMIPSTDIPNSNKSSPRLSNKLQISIPPPKIRLPELTTASDKSCSAYDNYLRLPELAKLWGTMDFPDWKNEPVLKPALVALEITFRFISTVLTDPRPYANRREWRRRLEGLAKGEIEVISMLCEMEEDDPQTRATAPIVDLTSAGGALARENSSAEVWKMSGGDTVVVSHVSESSLLPKLVTLDKFEAIAKKVQYSIECAMQDLPYTLGLGEPNLSGKPSLDYDAVCKPGEVHRVLKKCDHLHGSVNFESQILCATHQILESWVRVARQLLLNISDDVDSRRYDRASGQCWVLEKVWMVVSEIEDMHLLMDPDDFLRLKIELGIKASSESELFCFRSRGLVEITKLSKELKHKVPAILGVEVDPTGGPRIQDAAMEMYRRKDEDDYAAKIHLMQGMQAVESAVKKFYFSYKQLLAVVMGSLEANRDLLSQIFMEPTYFPSLDAAKTFLGERWSRG